MPEVAVVGVDGCPGGWVAARLEPHGASVTLYPDIATLAAAHRDAALALIDIPIGLPDESPRLCDRMARNRLGARHSTLFSVPCREAVYARDYTAACAVNLARLGRKLSRQSWNICARIAEVDRWLQCGEPPLLRESHPELCFRALAGGRPVTASKRQPEGIAARTELLAARLPELYSLVAGTERRYRRRLLHRDDILDALVLAVAASVGESRLESLPADPPCDRTGLPMAILCPPSGIL